MFKRITINMVMETVKDYIPIITAHKRDANAADDVK
jgi:hypothetical protein